MSRHKGFDAFCGAGGTTRGFQLAGFEMWGCDIVAQPNYVGEHFIQDNALELLADRDFLSQFNFVVAGPPCQAYSALKNFTTSRYPKLIEPVRELLEQTGLPYIIENVPGAPLINPIRLCGSSFGLGVWRHRLFELGFPAPLVPPCSHQQHPKPLDVTGTGGLAKTRKKQTGGLSRKPSSLRQASEAMGIDWMTRSELAEAVPPAFTEFIGAHLLAEIHGKTPVSSVN